jgi:thiamine biosynthesis lipoprotein
MHKDTQKDFIDVGESFETWKQKDISEGDWYIDQAVEVSRIENLISDWIPTTPISEVNKAGIKPVKYQKKFLI